SPERMLGRTRAELVRLSACLLLLSFQVSRDQLLFGDTTTTGRTALQYAKLHWLPLDATATVAVDESLPPRTLVRSPSNDRQPSELLADEGVAHLDQLDTSWQHSVGLAEHHDLPLGCILTEWPNPDFALGSPDPGACRDYAV